VGLARAHGYGSRFDDYRTWLERESLVIVQVEDVKAVENLDKILSVDGIDGYLVGPYDLSCSLKVPGQFEHPSVVEALQEIRRIGAGYEAFPGYHVVQPDAHLVIQKIQEGYRFVAYGVDMLFLGEMCRRGLREIMTCR